MLRKLPGRGRDVHDHNADSDPSEPSTAGAPKAGPSLRALLSAGSVRRKSPGRVQWLSAEAAAAAGLRAAHTWVVWTVSVLGKTGEG